MFPEKGIWGWIWAISR